MAICPNCGKKSIDPILKSKPYLIVKDSLTNNEVEQVIPFTLAGVNKYGKSENTTSYYLAKEFGMVGLNFQIMSLTALWMHEPPTGKKSKDEREAFQKCLDWSISEVIKASVGKKIVLLMGAEVTRTFTGYSVNDISGLVCRSDLMPHVNMVIAAPNPDNIMKQSIGELRNALKVFKEQVQICEQYEKL